MKVKQLFIGIVFLALIGLFISGCGPKCPDCPDPAAWTKCSETAVKTRTNYRCGERTSYNCESYCEEAACKTQIALEGSKGLEATVSPTLDETVKGTISVTVNSFPTDATKIWVMMGQQGRQPQPGEDPFSLPNSIIQIEDAVNGKVVYIDTTTVDNGVYTLGVMATSNPNGAPWADVVQTQLVVEN